jgi:hypothetical protein
MKPKIATVTESDVAIFLARREPKKKKRKDHKVRSKDSVEDISEFFLENFSAANLLNILKVKNGRKEDPITMEWIVQQMLGLLNSPDAKVSERLTILDRLRDLLLLGGLQNPDLIAEVVKKTTSGFELTPPKKNKDPFTGEGGLRVVS